MQALSFCNDKNSALEAYINMVIIKASSLRYFTSMTMFESSLVMVTAPLNIYRTREHYAAEKQSFQSQRERERERERCTHPDGWFAVDIEVLSIRGQLPQVVVEKGKWRFKTNHLLLKRKERESEQKYKEYDNQSQTLTCMTELVVSSV